MTVAVRLLSIVGVRPSEWRLVGRLFALYFVLISALVLIQSMAFGLFIASYGAGRLPFAYLTIAVVGSLVTFAYLRIGARVTFARLLGINLVFLALGSLTLWALLRTGAAASAVFLLPVWFQIFVTLVNLVVWPLARRLFDVRQSKPPCAPHPFHVRRTRRPYPELEHPARHRLTAQPCRRTISPIQSGANGDVHPLDTG